MGGTGKETRDQRKRREKTSAEFRSSGVKLGRLQDKCI